MLFEVWRSKRRLKLCLPGEMRNRVWTGNNHGPEEVGRKDPRNNKMISKLEQEIGSTEIDVWDQFWSLFGIGATMGGGGPNLDL